MVNKLAILFLANNTLALFVLFDALIGKPIITGFLALWGVMFFINYNYYRR
jgi:hypothetical protein